MATITSAGAQSRSSASRQLDALPGHLPQLDALRGFACLFVLVAHLKGVRGLNWMPLELGVFGVGVLFVLSGFLITRILLDSRARGGDLNEFYDRRVARILPLYFAVLLVVGVSDPSREVGWAATFSLNLNHVTGSREYFHVDAGPTTTPPVAMCGVSVSRSTSTGFGRCWS